MNFIGIIPARYHASRFPGKPLAIIDKKSMIQRVHDQAIKADKLSNVIVATDDERIQAHVKSFGGQVMMTASTHISGTDRCAEVAQSLGLDIDVVINIQGDEPFIDPNQINQIAEQFERHNTDIASLYRVFNTHDEVQDANKVKVVVNDALEALYFSRAPIPYLRKELKHPTSIYKEHIGIYGFRKNVLEAITQLPPSNLESIESLEQLRWIAAGYTIQMAETSYKSMSIDTPADLAQCIQSLKR